MRIPASLLLLFLLTTFALLQGCQRSEAEKPVPQPQQPGGPVSSGSSGVTVKQAQPN